MLTAEAEHGIGRPGVWLAVIVATASWVVVLALASYLFHLPLEAETLIAFAVLIAGICLIGASLVMLGRN